MSKVVLITANGDGTRMRQFFDMPKHHLYYKGKKIIDNIIDMCESVSIPYYVASKIEEDDHVNVILCNDTKNRMQTIKKCINQLCDYDTMIIHDCDIIFDSSYLDSITGETISVSLYKNDGKKYGFVSVDRNIEYKHGNEKEVESEFITTGIYACNVQKMKTFLNSNPNAESMLEYYNHNKPKLLYTNTHINLGDIESYMNNL